MNIESIKKQAKEIIDKFARKLENVKFKEKFVEREENMREEVGEERGNEEDSDFRDIAFGNAPNKEGDYIKAEKGGWVE